MARRILFLLSLAGSLVGCVAAAQRGDVTGSQPDGVVQVTLGQAAVALYGPWKFTVGDSPIDAKTGKPLWAEPDFDDSKWETVDLKPEGDDRSLIVGDSGEVPGWTTRGHPGTYGYAWYRIRVQVRARPGEALALGGPAEVDDVYQFFDNGELAGQFGDFSGKIPKVYDTQLKLFPLAKLGSGAAGTGTDGTGQEVSTRVLAFRLWMAPFTLFNFSDTGGLLSAPILGKADAMATYVPMYWLVSIRTYAMDVVLALLFGQLAVVAVTLLLFDRSDRVYLWMGSLFLLSSCYDLFRVLSDLTEVVSSPIGDLLTHCLVLPLIYAAWVMVWRVWFGQQRPTWLPRLTALLTLLLVVSYILGDEVFFGIVPHAVALHFSAVSMALRLLIFGLLFWVVAEGIRRKGVEGWLVLPVVALWGITAFSNELSSLRFLHLRGHWFVLGVNINLFHISSLIVAVVIALLLLRRLLQSVKRQRMMALDVKQAQEVQQVILPEARLALAGLTVESEYRPAREVGGDFFQIIPHKTDGSVLIVAGDVTGKGLKAGMLVALLVGAIRSTVDWSTDPMIVLNALNQRLIGRGDAQATCLALRIERDGSATLANAGHVAPYLNGEELPMEGALPLGMFAGAESSVMHFNLEHGDRLTMMSDGVAEATDASGQLFGFERVNSLLRTAKTIAEIAAAAQAFGQEDDISVIAVTRMGGVAMAA